MTNFAAINEMFFYMMKLKEVLLFLLLAVLLLSCGTERGRFRLEGRLRNMNQAEFWVCSPDGLINGIDTIRVRNGRFSYELDVSDQATLVVIFPNYSEQPVFAESGSLVTIKGDATNLKEMVIEGTTVNEDMTTLRMKLNDLTPPDIPKAVEEYVRQNLQSPASVYLVKRYFLQTVEPDLRKAKQLTDLMIKEQPDNGQLIRMQQHLKRLVGSSPYGVLPAFTATDIKGRKTTEKMLRSKVNVVYTWATWSYQSSAMQNRLMKLKQQHGDKLSVMAISLDGSTQLARQRLERDSLKWSVVCDERMWESPLLSKFGFYDVPGNVITDASGRIIARNVGTEALEEKINKLLK